MRRKKKNIWKYVAIVVLVAVLVGGGFLIWKSAQTEVVQDDETGQSVETGLETGAEFNEEDEQTTEVSEKEAEVGKEKVAQFDGDDPNMRSELTGVITYAGVDDESLMVRVNIDQYLAEGSCKLELLKEGEMVHEETAEVVNSAATATCKGFDVATTGLPAGRISVKILVTAGEKTGTIEGEVDL